MHIYELQGVVHAPNACCLLSLIQSLRGTATAKSALLRLMYHSPPPQSTPSLHRSDTLSDSYDTFTIGLQGVQVLVARPGTDNVVQRVEYYLCEVLDFKQ